MSIQLAVVWCVLFMAGVSEANPTSARLQWKSSLATEVSVELPQYWQSRELSHETLQQAAKIILPFSISQLGHDETLPVFCEDRYVNKADALQHLEAETNLVALPVDGLPDLVIICRMSHDDLNRFDHSTNRGNSVFHIWLVALFLIISLTITFKFAYDWYFYSEFDHAYGF